ncbi:pyocin knob domain-containing protein [Glutamicibacter creatinolyticus]|uniref:pyocin knob domain-containing protein n=1 Tax=Glutamicibacter creatinolyticus TaxID=162496 RepID=UPI0031D5EFE4
MAAADKAKLDAATSSAVESDAIVRRTSGGHIQGRSFFSEAPQSTAATALTRKDYVDRLAATQDLTGVVDLNTYQADGFYRQGQTANASTANNYPIARAGLLTVRNLTNMTFQEYQVYGDSPDAGRKFWRGRYNSIWSPWQEVATASALTSVQSAVTAASAQISALQTTVPSLEELVATGHIAVAVNGTTPVTEFDWSANFTTFIAPFPLRVLSVDLMFDRWTLAANNTSYATIILRRARAGSFANIATKTTQATGGQPVAPRTAWGFAGSTWDTGARDMQAGDAVNLAFSFTGTGVKAVLPMSATIRYMPL